MNFNKSRHEVRGVYIDESSSAVNEIVGITGSTLALDHFVYYNYYR